MGTFLVLVGLIGICWGLVSRTDSIIFQKRE